MLLKSRLVVEVRKVDRGQLLGLPAWTTDETMAMRRPGLQRVREQLGQEEVAEVADPDGRLEAVLVRSRSPPCSPCRRYQAVGRCDHCVNSAARRERTEVGEVERLTSVV